MGVMTMLWSEPKYFIYFEVWVDGLMAIWSEPEYFIYFAVWVDKVDGQNLSISYTLQYGLKRLRGVSLKDFSNSRKGQALVFRLPRCLQIRTIVS